MKKSITFMVIVFAITLVFSLIGDGFYADQRVTADANENRVAVPAKSEVSAEEAQNGDAEKQVTPDVASDPGKRKSFAANQVDQAAGESTAASFDSLFIYDALLMLSFGEEETLELDRNTLSALQSIYTELGPSPDAETFAQLQMLLNEALPASAAQSFMQALKPYFAYKQAEQDVRNAIAQADPDGAQDPIAGYEQLVLLRRTYLGEETASRLYAEQEAQLPYMTEAMAVARDKSLTEEERAARLGSLQDAFNETASQMESPLASKVLAAKVERLRAAGASESEIFAVRSEVLGSAEAQRLAEAELASAQ